MTKPILNIAIIKVVIAIYLTLKHINNISKDSNYFDIYFTNDNMSYPWSIVHRSIKIIS